MPAYSDGCLLYAEQTSVLKLAFDKLKVPFALSILISASACFWNHPFMKHILFAWVLFLNVVVFKRRFLITKFRSRYQYGELLLMHRDPHLQPIIVLCDCLLTLILVRNILIDYWTNLPFMKCFEFLPQNTLFKIELMF